MYGLTWAVCYTQGLFSRSASLETYPMKCPRYPGLMCPSKPHLASVLVCWQAATHPHGITYAIARVGTCYCAIWPMGEK